MEIKINKLLILIFSLSFSVHGGEMLKGSGTVEAPFVAQYVRLYVDEAGESHFEDIDVELAPQEFAPPAKPLHIGSFASAIQSYWVGVHLPVVELRRAA